MTQRFASTMAAAVVFGMITWAGSVSAVAGEEAPTCRGVAATIVGEPGMRTAGTDGADVIVSNGATEVFAGAGDDLICATNVIGNGIEEAIDILGGGGADVVDTTGNHGVRSRVDLGEGDDMFVGGRSPDLVESGGPHDDYSRWEPQGADTVATGGGGDRVWIGGHPGAPDADVLHLGAGNDEIEVGGALGPTTWDGGQGENRVTIARMRPAGTWVFDNLAGQATWNGLPVVTWDSFMTFTFEDGRASQVSFVGSDEPETVRTMIALEAVDLGGGNDRLDTVNYEIDVDSPMRIDAGGGDGDHDFLSIGSAFTDGTVDLDLSQGRLRFVRPGQPGAVSRVEGFEQTRVRAAWARVRGTSGPDLIDWNACRGSVSGLAGDDVLRWVRVIESSCGYFGADADIPVAGGGGDDALVGGIYPDVLLGGRGIDYADGKANTDACRAEAADRCERR